MKKFRILVHCIPAGWEGIWYGLRHLVSGGIALATRSRFTHVEIWTPMHDGGFVSALASSITESIVTDNGDGTCSASVTMGLGQILIHGTCWTSTLRDGYDGACKRPASEVLKNPRRWKYKEYECVDDDYESMILAMEHAVATNKGYDTWQIIRWYRRQRYDTTKYICSEFCQMALLAANKISYSPGKWRQFGQSFVRKALSPKDLVVYLPGDLEDLA